MKTRLAAATAVALALVAVPTMAQADVARFAAPVSGESELGGEGGASGIVIGVLAAAAVIAGIVIAVDDDDDEPVSA